MSTAAENFLRRHLLKPWAASQSQASFPGASKGELSTSATGLDAGATLPPSFSQFEIGQSGLATDVGGQDIPGVVDEVQVVHLSLDLPLDLDIDLPLTLSDEAALFTPVAPSPKAVAPVAARSVDLDLPLETVPAILWHSDMPGEEFVDSRRLRTHSDDASGVPGPVSAAAPAAAPVATSGPAVTDKPHWHGAIDTTLAKAWAQSQLVALLHVGSDHLADVSAALGATGEDAVKATFSERLQALLDNPERCPGVDGARLHAIAGGYLIVLPGLRSASLAETLARHCQEALARPLLVGDHKLALKSAVGISIFPHDGQQTSALLRAAGVAWRHASQRGRSGYQFYAQEMERRSLRRLSLEAEFREALTHNEIVLEYQPRAAALSGALCGADVQLTWSTRLGSPFRTTDILALAEDMGMSEQLAHWLLKRACEQIKAWAVMGLGAQRLALPMHLSALRRSYSVQRLHEILYDHGIGLGQIVLMLLPGQSGVMGLSDPNAPGMQRQQDMRDMALRLDPLRDAGFGMAVDGASTSASALASLRRLPLSEYRLDASVLDSLDDAEGTLTHATIDLAHRLGLRVVAAGVTSELQFERLRNIGADEIQGELLSSALSAETWGEILLGAQHLAHAETDSGSNPDVIAMASMDARAELKAPTNTSTPAPTDSTACSGPCDIIIHVPTTFAA